MLCCVVLCVKGVRVHLRRDVMHVRTGTIQTLQQPYPPRTSPLPFLCVIACIVLTCVTKYKSVWLYVLHVCMSVGLHVCIIIA